MKFGLRCIEEILFGVSGNIVEIIFYCSHAYLNLGMQGGRQNPAIGLEILYVNYMIETVG